MGPVQENIVKQALRMGQPIPDRILNAPELYPGLGLYLSAFFHLDSERSHAFGPTAIPITSVVAYAHAFNFDEEQVENLLFFIREMDNANLKRVKDKQTASGNKK